MCEIEVNNVEINKIRNNTDEAKIEFISNVISLTDIPADFSARSHVRSNTRSSEDKIFFEIINGKAKKREWVLFVNSKFYCVYCLCFSSLDKNRFVTGIEYVKNCRIVDKLKKHGKESNHETAEDSYLRKVANHGDGQRTYQSAKRNVVKCIVKIIIFITTQG